MKAVIPFISKLPFESKATWLEYLQKAMPDENIELIENVESTELSQVEIAIVADPDLNHLKKFRSLKWVHTLGAGVEGVIDSAKENDFKIVRMIDTNLSNTMAESVLTWCLYLNKQIPAYLNQQKNKHWNQLKTIPAKNCKIGILGLGEMGKTSAQKLLKNNFQVLGWSRLQKNIKGVTTFHGEQELDDFTKQCQILICLLPLTKETRGLVDSKLLMKLSKGSSLINFSRGGVVNTHDLIKALDNRHIEHAVLDVFEQEPLPVNDELWINDHVTILPHVAAITAPHTASKVVAKNIQNYREIGFLREFVDLIKGY